MVGAGNEYFTWIQIHESIYSYSHITDSNINPSTQVRFLCLKETTILVILMSSVCKDTHVASLFSCFQMFT